MEVGLNRQIWQVEVLMACTWQTTMKGVHNHPYRALPRRLLRRQSLLRRRRNSRRTELDGRIYTRSGLGAVSSCGGTALLDNQRRTYTSGSQRTEC